MKDRINSWLMLAMVAFLLGALSAVAFAKTETDSQFAGASVAYGKTSEGVLVPLKVDSDGGVDVGGSPTLENLTISGNLGIGSSNPSSKLVIVGVGTTSATNSLMIRNSALSPKITITDAGNVGIGTTDPRVPLEVNGAIYGTSAQLFGVGNVGIGTADPLSAFQVGTGARSAGPTVSATDTVFKNAVQIDGVLYNPGMQVISGNYVCYDTTSKRTYVKSTCP